MEVVQDERLPEHGCPENERLPRLLLNLVKYVHEPNEMLRCVCDYMGAVCAVLWIRNTYTADEFRVHAHHRRPDFGDADDIYFSLRDDDIVAVQSFDEGQPISGLIGEPPFAGSWLKKHYTQALGEVGAKFIVVSPIVDATSSPYGVLSLYFAGRPSDISTVESWIKLVDEAIYLVINSLVREIDLVVGERRKMGHEITSAVGSIRRSLLELQGLLDKDGPKASARRGEHLNDTLAAVNQIEQSTKHYRFKDSVRELRKNAEYISFRSEFNSASQPLIKQHSSLRVTMSSLKEVGFGEPSVLFARPHLRELIGNLVGNAIKYSVYGGTVAAEFRRSAQGAVFQVSNLSNGIPEEERQRIWTFGYRGSNKLQGDIPGDGIGLNVVDDICDVYGLTHDYNEDPREGTTLIWSRFLITFPLQLVRWS